MGTIPLVESFTDVRNLATLATHGTVLGLLVTAVVTRSRQTSVILIMVSRYKSVAQLDIDYNLIENISNLIIVCFCETTICMYST